MTSNDIILRAHELTKSYGRPPAHTQVLHGVDLAVRCGEFVAIMGPSGSGKSTLLHMLGRMSRPDSGRLEIDGRDVTDAGEGERTRLRGRNMGFVFQRFNLIGTVSARDNLAISFRVRGLPPPAGAIDELLEQMGVSHVAERKSGQMSIGEQQRVAVARALAHRPGLVLADEPTGSLDSANAEALLRLLRQANGRGQTIVMITHSAGAATRADRIVYMKDGRIEEDR